VLRLIVSLKSSDVLVATEAYRLYAKLADYPTHIGITEAGKPPYAVTKSAAGLAPILLDGIGDTIRISLLGDPVPEIAAAFDILQATQRRVRRPELIACPTCGRLAIDLEDIIAQLERRLGGRTTPVIVRHGTEHVFKYVRPLLRRAALQRFGARRAKRHVPHPGARRRSELERVALVIVPGAKVYRVAFPAAFGHPHDVDEETKALFGLRREQLDVCQVREIE
jgi:hypothetical protein